MEPRCSTWCWTDRATRLNGFTTAGRCARPTSLWPFSGVARRLQCSPRVAAGAAPPGRGLAAAIPPSTMSTVEREGRTHGALRRGRAGLGWRSYQAHTCSAGVAERRVAVAVLSNKALKLTAPANWSAAA